MHPGLCQKKVGIIPWHIETDLFLNGQQIANLCSPSQQCNHMHLYIKSWKRGGLLFLRSNRKRHFYSSEALVWKENLTHTHTHMRTPHKNPHTQSSSCAQDSALRKKKKKGKNKRLKGSRQKKTELLCDVFARSLPPSTSSLPKWRL